MAAIYLALPNGEQRECEEFEVGQLWELGLIKSGTLYWKDGMDDWKPVEEMFPSQPTAPTRPPLPSAPPSPAPNLPGPLAQGTGGLRQQLSQEVSGGTYAGFWKRVLAVFIDILLLMPISFAAGYIWGTVAVEVLGIYDLSIIEAVGNLIGVIIGWTYFSAMESGPKQGTLGKMALGIKVTDLDGNRISFGRATGRHFAKWLSALILGIGYIMAAFTAKKQGLHDQVAGCLVVNK